MATINITVRNPFSPNLTEVYTCFDVDISDLNEVEYCASECCGQFLDEHEDIWNALDTPFETIAEACEYIIEETTEYDT